MPRLRYSALALALVLAADPAAADTPRPLLIWEAGVRVWASTGSSAKDLYLPAEFADNRKVSRLEYRGRHAAVPELYGRVDHGSGVFLKAKAGIGGTGAGDLVNEDFPPIVLGYSRTNHPLDGGELAYWSADLGYTLIERDAPILGYGAHYRIGLFAGYHRYREEMLAFGCRQTVAGQSDSICVPSIGTDQIVIAQSNVWDGLRLGLASDVSLGSRLRLSIEASWLRLALDGRDTHFFRSPPRCTGGACFTGAQRESGEGDGLEVEVSVTYALAPRWTLGAGTRYWRYSTEGSAHLRFQDGASRTPPLNWDSDRIGVFVQAGIKLD